MRANGPHSRLDCRTRSGFKLDLKGLGAMICRFSPTTITNPTDTPVVDGQETGSGSAQG